MNEEPLSSRHSLVHHEKLNPSRLLRNQYTISLLNEGIRAGLLSHQETDRIQQQLLSILKTLIKRYIQGKSSSVTSDTAESLFTSILYAVDAYLIHLENPEKAINTLKNIDVANTYEQGVDLIRACLLETQQLYQTVYRTKIDVAVDAYTMTIEESIPLFLKKYGILFDAHNTMASIDYPLAIDDMKMAGVYYLKQYVTHLKLENQFCQLFALTDLQQLLVDYGRKCRFDYRIELFNIFELVFQHAIFAILAGSHASQITISSEQFQRLEARLYDFGKLQIQPLLAKTISQLLRDFNISDPLMTDYLQRCGGQLVQRMKNVLENQRLESLVMVKKEGESQPIVTTLVTSEKMSDHHFQILLEKISSCDHVTDKVDLIRCNVHSLHDYLDLLEANCLLHDEYDALRGVFSFKSQRER